MKKHTAAFLLVLSLTSSSDAEPTASVRPSVRTPFGAIFESALARAKEKLEAPACRLVLVDFRDATGRPLAENLGDRGLSASEFLESLDYRDGRNEDICHRRNVDAFTAVGGATVWTCPGGSLRLGGENPRSGANALIHEMLHALGLAENPPTSQEINRHVRERCGL